MLQTRQNICYLFPYSLLPRFYYQLSCCFLQVKIWHWERTNTAESTSKWQSYWQLNLERMKEWCEAKQYSRIREKTPTDMWPMCASSKRHYIQCVCYRNVLWMPNMIDTMHTFFYSKRFYATKSYKRNLIIS